MLDVFPIPAFADNYLWLIRAPRQPDRAVVVDPGDALAVKSHLDQYGLALAAILVTHHHHDHTGGIRQLLEIKPVPVYGPANEAIAGVTHHLVNGDEIDIATTGLRFSVIEVPGHTSGHIAYFGHGAVFCGDTMFCAGCGRLFEGTAAQMSDSLARLANLPPDTKVYCTHEYTLDNLRFALTVEPENNDLQRFFKVAGQLRHDGRPTLPSTIGTERAINPFLRCDRQGVREAASRFAHRRLADPVEVFAVIRKWKDGFAR